MGVAEVISDVKAVRVGVGMWRGMIVLDGKRLRRKAGARGMAALSCERIEMSLCDIVPLPDMVPMHVSEGRCMGDVGARRGVEVGDDRREGWRTTGEKSGWREGREEGSLREVAAAEGGRVKVVDRRRRVGCWTRRGRR